MTRGKRDKRTCVGTFQGVNRGIYMDSYIALIGCRDYGLGFPKLRVPFWGEL